MKIIGYINKPSKEEKLVFMESVSSIIGERERKKTNLFDYNKSLQYSWCTCLLRLNQKMDCMYHVDKLKVQTSFLDSSTLLDKH